MTFEFLGQDFSRYVVGTISESVDYSSGVSSVIEKMTTITLSNAGNKFSKMLGGIKYIGEEVHVYDDYGTIYKGVVRNGRKDKGNFILTCESRLSTYFMAYVSTEQLAVTPSAAIKTILLSFGLDDYIDGGSFDYATSRYGATYINVFSSASQGLTLSSLINTIGELGSLHIGYQNGKIRCVYPDYPDSSDRNILDRSFRSEPSLSYNDNYYTAYSVDYVGSGTTPLPAQGGDTSTGKVWTQSTGAGNPVQVANFASAVRLGELRVNRDKDIKRKVSGTVSTLRVPVQYPDVYQLDLNSIDVSGLFRVVSYTRDENVANAVFEEVLL